MVKGELETQKEIIKTNRENLKKIKGNKKWKTNPIDAPEYEKGSKEWLAKKDIMMAKVSDIGLAIILDEGAKATRKNVERLIEQNKDVKVYELSSKGKKFDRFIAKYSV